MEKFVFNIILSVSYVRFILFEQFPRLLCIFIYMLYIWKPLYEARYVELSYCDIDCSDNTLLSLYRFHCKYPCWSGACKASTRKETCAIARRRLKFSHRFIGSGTMEIRSKLAGIQSGNSICCRLCAPRSQSDRRVRVYGRRFRDLICIYYEPIARSVRVMRDER